MYLMPTILIGNKRFVLLLKQFNRRSNMKFKNLSILFIIIMLLSMVAALSAGTQKTCPVMGGEINKSLFVEQDGKKIYVCCESCIEELTNNFSKYEKKLTDSGQSVEVVSATSKTDKDEDCKTTLNTSKKSCCTDDQAVTSKSCSSEDSKTAKKSCSTGSCKK